MRVIPAVDIMGGKVVRLVRGDPSQSTIYSDSPLDAVRKWQVQGARLVHIVDLDAALGRGSNLKTIEEIVREVDIEIQVGGGLRSLDTIAEVIAAGAHRVVVGTRALEEEFVKKILKEFGERIALGIDALNSNVAIEGWQTHTSINCLELIEFVKREGAHWIIYTDVLKDGTLEGPNFESIRGLRSIEGMNYIVAGGFGSLDDVAALKRETSFIWGFILGKALYEEKIDLKEAMQIAETN